jgi:hypothetical protein
MDKNNFPLENKLVYLPNNYYVWIRTIMEYGAYEYGALATALLDEDKIQFDYVVAHIPLDIFTSALSTKGGATSAAPEGKTSKTDPQSAPINQNPTPTKVTSKMVMSFPGGEPIVDHAKLLVLKAREKVYAKAPSFFSYMMSTMSTQSKHEVQADAAFMEAQAQSDVFALAKITKSPHVRNLQAESMRLEALLQAMHLGNDDFSVFSSRFNDILVALDNAGATMDPGRSVYMFLDSLKGSPLQPASDRWLDDTSQTGFPQSFQQARNLMNRPWINRAPLTNIPPAVPPEMTFVAHPSPPPREKRWCVFCDKQGHSSERCNSWKIERSGDTLIVVRKDRSGGKHKKGHSSGLVLEAAANASFAGGLYNLLSYRALVELGFEPHWSADSISMTSPQGSQYVFQFDQSTGLYQKLIQYSSYFTLGEHFSAEQRKRAVLVKELHELTNHASAEQMIALLESSCLLDTPLTPKDIRIGCKINEPCNACEAGKFMNPPSLPSTSTPTSCPGELLHADIAFFQEGGDTSKPYLTVVDDFSGFTYCLKLPNKSAQAVTVGLINVINEFKAWSLPVKTIRTDSENVFRSVKPQIG